MSDQTFDDVPPGSIPASKSGVYRRDHFAIRGAVYSAMMQVQQPRYDDVHMQQMQQQQGSRMQQG